MVHYNNDLDEYESHYYTVQRYEDDGDELDHQHYERNASNIDSADRQYFARELPTVGHAISGAIGGALANFATYPIDVVSTRLKVQRHAREQRLERERLSRTLGKQKEKENRHRSRKRESSSSRSTSDSEIPKVISGASQSQDHEYAKYTVEEVHGTYESVWETSSYQQQGGGVMFVEEDDEELYKSHFDAFKKIVQREGIAGLYHGVGWDTAGHVANGFWYFMAYTALRKQRLHVLGHNKNVTLPVMEELTLGIAASALSGLVSTPFSNIVTRKQTHALLYPKGKRPSFADIYHDIMRDKGITGFWSGYAASLLLTFNPSITFLLYEFAKPHAVKLKRGRFSKLDMFLLVALCKAAATTLTFPLNTIRIRSQMDDGGDEWEGIIESSRVSKGKHGKGLDARYRRTLKRASGIIELITQIVKREGISALYIGLGGALFRGFFTHGVTTMIRQQVHHFILKLYFFVLDAYNRNDAHGSLRQRVLEKTLEGAHKAGHAIGSSKHKLDSVKEKVLHLGERVSENAHLGHHNNTHSHTHSHAHSQTHSHHDEHEHDHRVVEHERMIEARREEEHHAPHTLKGWSEVDMFEKHFVAPQQTEHTAIHEERITTGASHRGRSHSRAGEREVTFRLATPHERTEHTTIREEHITSGGGEHEAAFRDRQASAAAAHVHNITTTTKEQVNPSATAAVGASVLVGAPPVPLSKSMEKVSAWRHKVAEETAAAAAAVEAVNKHEQQPRVTTRHEVLEGAHGERIDRTITTRDMTIDNRRHHGHNRRIVSRDPSMASGQTYRSAAGNTGRTSLLVHPPSSVRERIIGQREEWVDEVHSASGTRRVIGRGDKKTTWK